MVRATTPTLVLTLSIDIDLTEAENVYFTMTQGYYKICKDKSGLSIQGNEVRVPLTQPETLPLYEGGATLQLNWTYPGGLRACSEIVTLQIGDNLLRRIVE